MAYEVIDDEDNGEGGLVAPGASSGVIQPTMTSSANQQGEGDGGGFATLQKYITANRNQAGSLADRSTENITKASEEARQIGGQAAQQFQSQVQSQLPTYSSSDLGQLDWTQGGQISQKLSNQPQIKQALSQTYQGPTDFQPELSQAFSKSAEAKQMADLTESEPGRFQILRETFKTPNYTQGQQRLDQALLQQDPNARQKFESVRESVGQNEQELSNLRQQALGSVEPTRQAIEQNKQDLYSRLNDAASNYQNFLAQQAAAQNKAQQDLYNQTRSQIQNAYSSNQYGNLNQLLTGSPQSNLNLGIYGIDPSQFLKTTGQAATAGNVADASRRADMAALSDLLGVANPLASSTYVDPSTRGVEFDRMAMQNAIQQKVTDFMSDPENPLVKRVLWAQAHGDPGYTMDQLLGGPSQSLLDWSDSPELSRFAKDKYGFDILPELRNVTTRDQWLNAGLQERPDAIIKKYFDQYFNQQKIDDAISDQVARLSGSTALSGGGQASNLPSNVRAFF